jgi:hypothetical protein
MTDRIALVIATIIGLLSIATTTYCRRQQKRAARLAFRRLALAELQVQALSEELKYQVAFDKIRRLEEW